VTLHPERLDEPLRWKKPSRVFVVSMGDLFHEDVPTEYIFQVWERMRIAKQHVFKVLTKRPERMSDWVEYHTWSWLERIPLPNVWLGVSVENQDAANERIPLLLQTSAAVRFVSYEPALEPVDFAPYLGSCPDCGGSGYLPDGRGSGEFCGCNAARGLDWVIAGGETGPGARPADLDWFRRVRDDCVATGTPFFFKQADARRNRLLDGRMWEEWPE
jgi:protein gp37